MNEQLEKTGNILQQENFLKMMFQESHYSDDY